MSSKDRVRVTNLTKDLENKKIRVEKEFDAPLEEVWKAWTDSAILDEWWAPKPWKAETKTQEFKVGGMWLYCMVGPEGERHWARFDYKSIEQLKSFSGADAFCDENGNKNSEMPSSTWHNVFSKTNDGTRVVIELTCASTADLEMLLKMGFEEGFKMGLGNLDELLAR